MKKTMKKLTTILMVALLVGAASCKKYEEGPGFSLRSKKARVANTWIIDQYVDADGDVQKETDSDTYEMKKDGTFTRSYGSTSFDGKWEFRKDKEQLAFVYEHYESVYTIIKLKEKELWLADEDKDEIHFVPKN